MGFLDSSSEESSSSSLGFGRKQKTKTAAAAAAPAPPPPPSAKKTTSLLDSSSDESSSFPLRKRTPAPPVNNSNSNNNKKKNVLDTSSSGVSSSTKRTPPAPAPPPPPPPKSKSSSSESSKTSKASVPVASSAPTPTSAQSDNNSGSHQSKQQQQQILDASQKSNASNKSSSARSSPQSVIDHPTNNNSNEQENHDENHDKQGQVEVEEPASTKGEEDENSKSKYSHESQHNNSSKSSQDSKTSSSKKESNPSSSQQQQQQQQDSVKEKETQSKGASNASKNVIPPPPPPPPQQQQQQQTTQESTTLSDEQVPFRYEEVIEEEEFIEEEVIDEEEAVQVSSNTDMGSVVVLAQKRKSRQERGAISVVYQEPHVTGLLEYNQWKDSALSVNDPNHVAEEHDKNELPWYEQDYEELPWHMQPDLDEDDELTALCKKILVAGEDGEVNERILADRTARVEANVMGFALKLKNKAIARKNSKKSKGVDSPSKSNNNSSINNNDGDDTSKQTAHSVASEKLQNSSTSLDTISSLSKRRWSVIDSGRQSQKLERSPGSQVRRMQNKRHSISGVPEKGNPRPLSYLFSSMDASSNSLPTEQARLKMIDSGYKHSAGRRSSLLEAKAMLKAQAQELSEEVPELQAFAPTQKTDQAPSQSQHTRQQEQEQQQQELPPSRRYPIETVQSGETDSLSSASADVREHLRRAPSPLFQQTYQVHPPAYVAVNTSDTSSIHSAASRVSFPDYPYQRPYTRGDSLSRNQSAYVFSRKDDDSVPFDEPKGRELFQDEYYCDSLKLFGRKGPDHHSYYSSLSHLNQKSREKSRQQSRHGDPPGSMLTSYLRGRRVQPDASGIQRRSKKDGVNEMPLNRYATDTNTMSAYRQLNCDPDPGPSMEATESFPPPELHCKIEMARAQQEELEKNPGPVPEIFQDEIEDLERQWKAYSNQVSSPVCSVREENNLEDLKSTKSNDNLIGAFQDPTTGGVELMEDELNLRKTGKYVAENESDTSPLEHALKHLHDDNPIHSESKSSCWQCLLDNLLGAGVCCFCAAVWIAVVVVAVTDAGSPYSSQIIQDEEIQKPTEAPSSGPISNGVDIESLLPSYSVETIQQDEMSAQSLALKWMKEQDISSLTEEKWLQRFSLATFYYAAVNGEVNVTDSNDTRSDFDMGNWINADIDECLWNEGLLCNKDQLLTQVSLRDQKLRGSIPQEVGLWKRLLSLDLGSNPLLKGIIPSTIGLLTTLQGLDLHSCDLEGGLPSELGLLDNLVWLTLASQTGEGEVQSSRATGDRKLSSTLPTELGRLTKLEHMRLESNNIRGQIPTQLGNLGQLRTLVLRENAIVSTIPTQLGRLTQLQGLALDFNGLTGSIPDELSKLTTVVEIHLSENKLDGTLPASLSELSSSLSWLSIAGNSFVGSLPVSWSEISKLEVLQLEDNPGLTGSIPIEWGAEWAELKRIWLHETSLGGDVPIGLCFLKNESEYPLETIGINCDKIGCDCGCWCS